MLTYFSPSPKVEAGGFLWSNPSPGTGKQDQTRLSAPPAVQAGACHLCLRTVLPHILQPPDPQASIHMNERCVSEHGRKKCKDNGKISSRRSGLIQTSVILKLSQNFPQKFTISKIVSLFFMWHFIQFHGFTNIILCYNKPSLVP